MITIQVRTLASGPYSPPLQISATFHSERVARHSHFKSADGCSQRGQHPVPSKMDSDGEPEFACAKESVAENDAETSGVDDAEPRGMQVLQVDVAEQNAGDSEAPERSGHATRI